MYSHIVNNDLIKCVFIYVKKGYKATLRNKFLYSDNTRKIYCYW